MTRTLYLIDGDDSYELVVNEAGDLLEIWRFALNQQRPKFVRYEWLDEELRSRIDDKLMRI